ncbi:MAG: dipeptidase [Bacteroidales bacterium]|nr:dipeptidase [Bacteroidales bacterium]
MKKIFMFAAALLLAYGAGAQTSDEAYRKKADEIHAKYITIDTHNDTAMYLNHPDSDDWSVTKGQVSFPKMKEGGLDAAFFAIFLDQGPLRDSSRDSVYAYAMNEVNTFKDYVSRHSDEAALAFSPEDVKKLKKSGKRIVILAIENGYAIGTDLDKIDAFYNAGCRYITLCHNYTNDICDASRYENPNGHGGLSAFGEQVVKRMNELGMLVDVSHASTSTLYDVIKLSKAPIFASHSAVRAIKDHPRNLTDEEIKAIAATGGVIQVATGRWCLTNAPKSETSVKHLADHIDRIKGLVGPEHIGLGTDFDGGGGMIDLKDCSQMKNITVELLKRGYTEKELAMFWGGNFMRVWKETIKIAEDIAKGKK